MLFEELIQRFKQEKNQPPQHANELLDFLQKSYILNEISIVDYKKLFLKLHKRNAQKPDAFVMRINQSHFQKVNIPG